MWIPFHGCSDELQMCMWWKALCISICHPVQSMTCWNTVATHSDMPLHWQCYSKTWARCYGGRLVFQMQSTVYEIYLSLCGKKKMHKSNQAALWRSHRTSSHLHDLEIIGGNGILSVSMGFSCLFGRKKKSQCASDKSTAIIPFCTICRPALRLSCGAVRT